MPRPRKYPVKSATASKPVEKPQAEKEIERLQPTQSVPKTVFPEYDQMKVPMNSFDWRDSGEMWNLAGAREKEYKAQFDGMIEKGFKVAQRTSDGVYVYIFFEKAG